MAWGEVDSATVVAHSTEMTAATNMSTTYVAATHVSATAHMAASSMTTSPVSAAMSAVRDCEREKWYERHGQ